MLRTKWTIWALVLLVLLCPYAQASAQIAHFGTVTGSENSSTFVSTTSFLPTGIDRILIAKISYKNSSDVISYVQWKLDGATYDDMTYLRDDVNGDARSAIYYLVAPVIGNRFVQVGYTTSVRTAISASAYTGVHQTTPFSSNAGSNGTDNAPTVTVTAGENTMVIDALCQVSAGPDTATKQNETERANLAATGGGTDVRHASQEDSTDPATMAWSMSDSDNWALSSGTLAPVVVVRARRFWGRRKWW